MRSTSNALRAGCGALAALLLLESGVAPARCRAASAEPVLLLKYSSPALSDEAARGRFAGILAAIEGRLDVRPVAPPRGNRESGPVLPEIDDATLRSTASRVAAAGRKMDRLEIREAERELSAVSRELRRFRLGEATRPLLADVFVKLGTVAAWDGNDSAAATLLAGARSLDPSFAPDPALHSPRFRELWNGPAREVHPEAEVLFETVPPGARILVDGEDRGTTPRRIKVPACRPQTLRLEHAGFQPAIESRQWFPGDVERVEVVLEGDREWRLASSLRAPGPGFPEAAPIVSEMAYASGVSRVAILVLDRSGNGEEMKVIAASASDPVPRLAGTVRFGTDEASVRAAVARAPELLAEAGWPALPAPPPGSARPWYHRWWFWTCLGFLAAGAAVALGGGGGDGGDTATTSGSSSVSF
jgi:hypothetical protein